MTHNELQFRYGFLVLATYLRSPNLKNPIETDLYLPLSFCALSIPAIRYHMQYSNAHVLWMYAK